MNNDDELDIFFNNKKNKSDVKNEVIKKEDPKKVPLLSMKAFIFNFKKFYKEKTKIRNLLSEAAAKQRNISLKIYLKNYLVFNSL